MGGFNLIRVILFLILIISIVDFSHAESPTNSTSPRQRARKALTVSATWARRTSNYLSRLSSGKTSSSTSQDGGKLLLGPVLQACAGMMARSVDRLDRAVSQMGSLGRAGSPEYQLQVSNVETWVSAAITEQDTCLDGLSGDSDFSSGYRSVREVVKKKVEWVMHVTSDALSLVDRMG